MWRFFKYEYRREDFGDLKRFEFDFCSREGKGFGEEYVLVLDLYGVVF